MNRIFLEQSPAAPAYKTAAKAIPSRLQASGIQFVGKLNLENLQTRIDQITFRENSSFVPTTSGTRKSALYNPRTKTLVLNTTVSPILYYAAHDSKGELKDILSERVEPFILHEAFGAAGINDKKYDSSIGAYFLAHPVDALTPEQNKDLRSKLQRKLQIESGGSTTVGGGGNALGLWIKLKAMKTSLENRSPFLDFTRFFKILNFNIEGDFQCQHKELSLNLDRKEIRYCETAFWHEVENLDAQTQEIQKFLRAL